MVLGVVVIVNGLILNCVNYISVDSNDDGVEDDGFVGVDVVYIVVGVGFNGFLGYLLDYLGLYECDLYVVYMDIFGDIIDELFV